MKKILFSVLLVCGLAAHSQHYYNEWIDYTKTYYKFKLARTGLYRIPQSTLATAGLGGESAENFQLWRNGEQVTLYTSVATGPLAATDFIEFWGEMNDGGPDNELYKKPHYQLNNKWSLETDSATYFLTVHTGGNPLRFAATANNTLGNTLAPEPYFMHTVDTFYRNQINPGYALNVGEYLYSSSYDNGEGWTSANIDSAALLNTTFKNLYVYPPGPDAVLKFAAFGKGIQTRRIGIRVNNTVIDTTLHMDFFDAARKTYPVPLSLILSNTALVQFDNIANVKDDRMVVAMHGLTYPRLFNFGGASNFVFHLPKKGSNSYLEISGFAAGVAPPVLLDLTNRKRYIGDISAAPLVKFVIDPSAIERKLVLVKYDAANISAVSGLQERKFVDYTNAANSADYIIITNERLLNSTDGANPVEEYRTYRSSAAGGGYDAKIYREDEITDQFGYGIKKHPIALRNFILYFRNHFSPKHMFIIGKGVNYTSQYTNRNHADIDKLNLVATFGWPASDALLTADPGTSLPKLSFGRLSAINTREVGIYLKKVKEYEQAQQASSPNRHDRAWMKNIVHLNGINDPGLKEKIDIYFEKYKSVLSDTSFGGNVTTFSKTTTNNVEQISSSHLEALFKEGITLMTYFGHSAATSLEFNLDNPQAYDNKGKYPLFVALGCNAGDFFNFSTSRFIRDETLSEKYVLAEDRGTIGFIASTHFGIVGYLDIWNTQASRAFSATHYGETVGQIMVQAAKGVFENEHEENFYAIANVEETELHGDPAIRLNPHAKPDYVIDASLIKTAPEFVSVAEPFVSVAVKVVNIGQAVNKNVVLEVKRQYPNGAIETVRRDTLNGVHYADSIHFNLPVDAMRDKGTNKLLVTIDADGAVDELFESNNTVAKDIIVYEDELRPVFPYNYAIVSRQNIRFVASTADAFSAAKEYRIELDTTSLFNSPLKTTKSVTSNGGLIEFEPGVMFSDSTVYYWRLAKVPESGDYNWNMFSFVYLPSAKTGFNQSHYFQHQKADFSNIAYGASRQYHFSNKTNNLFIRNGVFPAAASQAIDFAVSVNSNPYIRSVCGISNIIVNVFDPVTFLPWFNAESGMPGQYGSDVVCGDDRKYNFQFNILNAEKRKNLVAFLDAVPSGHYIVARNVSGTNTATNTYAADWKKDTLALGAGNSIYHRLYNQGFTAIDSFNRPRAWIFVYKKDDAAAVKPKSILSEGIYDKITLSADLFTPYTSGAITSPVFGPAKQWEKLRWQGASLESPSTDVVSVDVLGIKQDGAEVPLYENVNQQEFDLSGINTQQYPFVKLRLNTLDTVHTTPYQLQYWQVAYAPTPEGAIAPNVYLNLKDTVDGGELFDIQIAFKNVTETAFDSLKVKMIVTDAANVPHVLPVPMHRPLAGMDTLHINYKLDTRLYGGQNSLYIDVNPDNHQMEQFHFNNFAYRKFYVGADSLNPLLDVTFDNMHILNNDIVSSKPDILIRLKDDSKWQLLDDTSLLNVQVRFPGEATARAYSFNSDTLRFTPAASVSDNAATINFNPSFAEDGLYELIVSGKDKAGNKASAAEYRVAFEVINKPMISNMLNYPNPFTTSTAFVFTLTGSAIPPEFKIQVLTVTGKVVREITRAELGPLRIGRNITDYKWDGTDQYGQKLANGVYLYRVVTSLNGKALEKYKAAQDETDKYFDKGYGKMYLMR